MPAVAVALLVMVKVSVALRFTPIGSGALSLVSVGEPGAVTVKVLVAAGPVPLLVVLTWLVVFVCPAATVVLVTLMVMTQLAPGATPPPPVNENKVSPCEEPGAAAPPQVLVKPGTAATDIPAVKGSVNEMPASETEFVAGLPIVKVSVDVAPAANELGANALAKVGATKTLVTSVSELLPLLLAGSPPPEIDAVLLLLGSAAAATATVRVIGFPEVLAAMAVALVQAMRVPPTTLSPAAGTLRPQVHPVPAADTKVMPAGRLSTMVVHVAAVPGGLAHGPATEATPPMLCGVIVYTPLVPTLKLPLWVLVTMRSVARTGVVRVEVLSPTLAAASEGSLTVAVLVTLGTAAAPTATVSVRAGADAAAAMVVGRVQTMRVPPTTLSPATGVFSAQVHPAPTAETKVRPAGRLSATV